MTLLHCFLMPVLAAEPLKTAFLDVQAGHEHKGVAAEDACDMRVHAKRPRVTTSCISETSFCPAASHDIAFPTAITVLEGQSVMQKGSLDQKASVGDKRPGKVLPVALSRPGSFGIERPRRCNGWRCIELVSAEASKTLRRRVVLETRAPEGHFGA